FTVLASAVKRGAPLENIMIKIEDRKTNHCTRHGFTVRVSSVVEPVGKGVKPIILAFPRLISI
ncbi:MAG: hypothetical protein WCO26_14790, partial [Deltaproteobacteria bacterium]